MLSLPERPNPLKKFLRNEQGVTSIEYGIIASMIALVIIGAVTTIGAQLTSIFTEVSSNLH